MKIVVLGAGALGSIIGGHLVRAGEDVIFIARGERAAFLQQHGIVVTGLVDFTVPATVTTHPHEVQAADVLLVTVKTYDTEAALASLRHLQVHSVLSLQNGVLKNEQLAHIFGWEHVLGAAAVVSGQVLPDGAVRFTLKERLALGGAAGGHVRTCAGSSWHPGPGRASSRGVTAHSDPGMVQVRVVRRGDGPG